MFLELHVVQNFAPANLNRDDRGAPKDCEFGGYRRARISSQCIKRAIREDFKDRQLLPCEVLARRTKRLVEEITGRLALLGHDADEARHVAVAALKGVGLGIDEKTDKTEYLLFLGEKEIAGAAATCHEYWDALSAVSGDATPPADGARRARSQDAKKAGKQAVPSEVSKRLLEVLDGKRTADLALFGRMIADKPEKNVDAASQVAHAISTNRVSMEFDFYTAVDDLKPDDTAGADMLGTVEYNSACFYRYSNVDLSKLMTNLGDDELAGKTVEAFVRASVDAIPTGKQNSMAAQNPPSLVLAVLRRHALSSLANAFVRPVKPTDQGDLVENSIGALDDYWGRLAGMYGAQDVAGLWCSTMHPERLSNLAGARVQDIEDLVAAVCNAVKVDGVALAGKDGQA